MPGAAICTRGMAGLDGGQIISITDHQIRVAIAGRRLIRFTYGSASRIAEPHDYGEQHGVVRLLVYQLRSMPFSRGWRLLDVSKMSELAVLNDTFAGSRGSGHAHHNAWDTLFMRVE
jgi:hypothetical protein